MLKHKFWVLVGCLCVSGLIGLLLPIRGAEAQSNDVVAQGLNGPLDIIVGPDGSLWVIDSGVGGDQDLDVFDGESGEIVAAKFGNSARVVKIDPATGDSTDVATLPSYATEEGATGGTALALHNGVLYVGVSEWISAEGLERPDGAGSVMSVSETGEVTIVADTYIYEVDNDPSPFGPPSSHPYGLLSGTDGELWIVDAAGNDLLSLDTDSGTITTKAVFDAVPGAFPHPFYDNELLTDAVPTGVTIGADGGIYVSLLPGAPFVPGSAKVLLVADDGSATDYATGLTMLTDLTTAPNGDMYAVQFAVFGEQGPDPTSGAIIKIGAGEGSEVVADGLSFPSAIAFAPNGDAYVTVGGVGPPGSGQVVRIAGLGSDTAGGTGGAGELPTTGSNTDLLAVIGLTIIAAGAMVLRSRAVRRVA